MTMHKRDSEDHQWHVLEWMRREEGGGFRFNIRWVCPCGATKVTSVLDFDLSQVGEAK